MIPSFSCILYQAMVMSSLVSMKEYRECEFIYIYIYIYIY
jgi:hypothetical protein